MGPNERTGVGAVGRGFGVDGGVQLFHPCRDGCSRETLIDSVRLKPKVSEEYEFSNAPSQCVHTSVRFTLHRPSWSISPTLCASGVFRGPSSR